MREKQKILIVDDKKENLMALKQVLKKLDADIIEASSGNQALAATLDHRFAVAILDVMMPGMDGYELAEFLRGDDNTRVIPIIFVTASFADERHIFKGYEAGGIDYIVKPFDGKVLLGKVKMFLELDRYRRELQRHREQLEIQVEERTVELKARAKEIHCLYQLTTLLTESRNTLEGMLAAAVKIIPSGWRDPESVYCRITVDGHTVITPNFKDTPWRHAADIVLTEGIVGEVTVGCLEEKNTRDGDPLIEEERRLLEDIARKLGLWMDGERAKARQKHLDAVLRSIRGVNRLIVHEKRKDHLIHEICKNLIASRGFQGAWVLLADGPPTESAVACGGLADEQIQHLSAMAREGRIPTCCRRGQSSEQVIISDTTTGGCKGCPLANTHAGNAAMTVGLVHNDHHYGWMSVYLPVAFATDPQEISLFMEIAGDISFALHGMAVEAQRKRSERTLMAIFQSASDGILMADAETGRFVLGNHAIGTMLGCSTEAIKDLSLEDIHPAESMDHVRTQFDRQVRGEITLAEALPVQRRDGNVFFADVSTAPLDLDGHRHLLGIVRDITGRKKAEEEQEKLQSQLAQAQKMESVGRLAGGVAHDYNNILSVIIGYSEMALDKVHPGEALYEDLQEILSAAMRSKDITRQLLAFARKQAITPEVLDLNASVEGMLKILRRLIGEDIHLSWLPGDGLWPVMMDPSQIDQILANLCVNARDAIANVGNISIETGTVTVDTSYCRGHAEARPGDFVLLSVSDDGCGMDHETLGKIFEPFFTTKGLGKGTGLGLSTVYGIVKQNNGFINVYSEPGQGTAFRIYLPRHEGEISEKRPTDTTEIPRGRGETVLLVEDDVSFLKLARQMLSELNYHVLSANAPGEALQLAEDHAHEIALLVTDVVMPEMNGRELAERIQILCPKLRCLYMSGYTADAIALRGVLNQAFVLLQKPFSKSELAIKVKTALEKHWN
ncbi:response regulator [Desulfosarcina cetonica]